MHQSLDFRHTEQFTVQMGERGRVVLPAPVRHQLGLKEGDELILTIVEDSVQLSSCKHLAKKFKGAFRHPASKKSRVDEFIAERRREAKREH